MPRKAIPGNASTRGSHWRDPRVDIATLTGVPDSFGKGRVRHDRARAASRPCDPTVRRTLPPGGARPAAPSPGGDPLADPGTGRRPLARGAVGHDASSAPLLGGRVR